MKLAIVSSSFSSKLKIWETVATCFRSLMLVMFSGFATTHSLEKEYRLSELLIGDNEPNGIK
jgi:hypothetical protein